MTTPAVIEPAGASEVTALMLNSGHPTASLPPTRPDPIDIAKRVNAGVKVELEAQRRRAAYSREGSEFSEHSCRCEIAIERLEAAIYAVFRCADDAEDLAREALERLDAE